MAAGQGLQRPLLRHARHRCRRRHHIAAGCSWAPTRRQVRSGIRSFSRRPGAGAAGSWRLCRQFLHRRTGAQADSQPVEAADRTPNQTAMFAALNRTGEHHPDLVNGDLAALTTKEIGQAARKGDQAGPGVGGRGGLLSRLGLINVVQLSTRAHRHRRGVSRMGAPLLNSVRKTIWARGPVVSGRQAGSCVVEAG